MTVSGSVQNVGVGRVELGWGGVGRVMRREVRERGGWGGRMGPRCARVALGDSECAVRRQHDSARCGESSGAALANAFPRVDV